MSNEERYSGMPVAVDALFVGGVGVLANGGAASGIDKRAVADARWLDESGVAGDEQADHVHHAGPHRALHHYPAEHYPFWRAHYPGFDAAFVPGVLGENISTRGITEADVCVGDVFTLGTAVIELAQPRQPCWKIDARLGIAGLMRAVITAGQAGWFYRVLEPGQIRAGDRLTRIERAGHGITLAAIWALANCRQPNADQSRRLALLADLPALAPSWRRRLTARAS
jgi:MOSC domain-containing protein YiiM